MQSLLYFLVNCLLILQVNGKFILKSGTDFRDFSTLTLTHEGDKVDVGIERVEVTSKFGPDSELKEALSEYECKYIIYIFYFM